MIIHDVQRTRVLYNWEVNDLLKRKGVRPITQKQADRIALALCGWVSPMIYIRDNKHTPYYDGLRIILTERDRFNLTLLHELAHFLTYNAKGHHPSIFVQRYIELMHAYFNWDAEELTLQAAWRGLI